MSRVSTRTYTRNYTPVIEKKLTFSKGRPIGSEKDCDIESWIDRRLEIKTVEDLYNLYKYQELEKIFQWAVSFRAGFAMIYRDDACNCELLMLEHPEYSSIDRRGNIIVRPSRLGPPKGGRESNDESAFGTAVRETFEETGINILDPKYGAKIMPPAFIYPRPELGEPELMLYFMVIFETKPEVDIRKEEICGYKWVDMTKEIRYVKNATTPTYALLNGLVNTNLYSAEVLESVKAPEDWIEFTDNIFEVNNH